MNSMKSGQSGARPWRWRMVPLALFGLPLFFCAFFLVLSPLQYLTGPINVFNVTRGWVAPTDLAGFYALGDEDRERATRSDIFLSGDSGLRLHADHTLRMIGFPAFQNGAVQQCHLNATGTWRLVKKYGETRLTATLTLAVPPEAGELPSCGLENVELRLIGHGAPYRLWDEWGDDDPWHALLYVRQ